MTYEEVGGTGGSGMAEGVGHRFGWQQLQNRRTGPLPVSVGERIAWYEGQVRRHRVGNYILETATVVVAASIPAAATLGASVAIAGVLGAALTVLAGLRQLLRPGENWIRFSRTLVELQREAVVWSAGGKPYDGDHADAVLIENVEDLIAQETTRWADQRTPRTPGREPDSHAAA
jgi:hypothetical protein